MSQDGELIICDGGLAGLVACTIAAKRTETATETAEARPIAWFVPAGDQTDEARRNAVRAAATILDLGLAESVSPATSEGPSESAMLLASAAEALRRGASTVTWAVHVGADEPDAWPDLDAIATRMDRALLCARLAGLDAGDATEVRIETPLIDLTDRQLAELAADLGVAAETCWWWGSADPIADAQRRRFGPLLEAAGLTPVSAA